MPSTFKIIQAGKVLPMNNILPKGEGDEDKNCTYYNLRFENPTNANIEVRVMYVDCNNPDRHTSQTFTVYKGNTTIGSLNMSGDWWCSCLPSTDGVYRYQ